MLVPKSTTATRSAPGTSSILGVPAGPRPVDRYPRPVFGTARNRQAASAPDRADDLAELVLKAHDGTDVRLGDLWRDQPAVLVFLRHYG